MFLVDLLLLLLGLGFDSALPHSAELLHFYPEAAADAGASGTVQVRYFVNVDGRVSGCVVTQSSGNAALDETTCRLIEQRYRYDPSRDADGRPVRSIIVVNQDWVLERVRDER